MKKYILILILNGLILSCNPKQERQSIDLIIDIEELEEIKITPGNFIKNSTYIQLETNENCLIGNNIEKLVVKDNQIFILDSNNKIFVFDTNGTFLNTIGEKGGGPNEQLSNVLFFIPFIQYRFFRIVFLAQCFVPFPKAYFFLFGVLTKTNGI